MRGFRLSRGRNVPLLFGSAGGVALKPQDEEGRGGNLVRTATCIRDEEGVIDKIAVAATESMTPFPILLHYSHMAFEVATFPRSRA